MASRAKKPTRRRASASNRSRPGGKAAARVYRRKPRASGGGGKRRGVKNAKAQSRFLAYAGEATFFAFSAAFALAALVVYIARDLPSTDGLWRTDRPPIVSLVAYDGSPIRTHGQTFGSPVRLSDLPSHASQAVLAIEDRNFYHHVGVNPISLVRALIVNAREGSVRQGGSTITQQLAKNLFLSSEQTYRRKLQELFLAMWLEQKFTKDELLTLYLNRVYFGAGAWGIDAASHRYFGKPASQLALGESAILAGLLKAPTQYAPDRNPKDAGARGRLVLEAMMDSGFITYEESVRAQRNPVFLAESRFSGAPYFVDHVFAAARAQIDQASGDLIIRTTLDPVLQAALEAGIAENVASADWPEGAQIAGIILGRDGAIRALVGGADYRDSQFNRATQARRQPGSAFKPFVYLAALEQGIDRDERLIDEPDTIDGWSPANYADKYYGEVSMDFALAHSLNAATIDLQERTGRGAVRLAARRMGLSSPLSTGAALALGVDTVTPLELASAYVPFANGGFLPRLRAIEQVETVDGNIVDVPPAGFRELAISGQSIRAVDAMLKGVVEEGTGRKARLDGAVAAGKTGTTQGNRDGWFVGYADGYTAVIWIGRDDNKPLGGDITGGGLPASIWGDVMERVITVRSGQLAAN